MENKLVDGLIYKAPRENAPDFVKGSVSVKVEEFKKYMDANQSNGWLNLDMLMSKGTPEKPSRIYFKLNDWKPKEQGGFTQEQREAHGGNQMQQIKEAGINVNEIPF